MGEQTSLELDLTFGDVVLHKLIIAKILNLKKKSQRFSPHSLNVTFSVLK